MSKNSFRYPAKPPSPRFGDDRDTNRWFRLGIGVLLGADEQARGLCWVEVEEVSLVGWIEYNLDAGGL